MSLEQSIDKLTEAVVKMTAVQEAGNALLEQVNSGREAAIRAAEKLGNTPAAAPKATKTTKAAEAAPAPAPAPEKPAAEDFSGDAGAQKVREIWAGYCGVDDETERNIRTGFLQRALKKVGAEKLTAVPEDKRALFAEWGRTLAAGENVEELAEESSGNSLLD